MSTTLLLNEQNKIITYNGDIVTINNDIIPDRYALLNRVKDDNDNDIGCVIAHHIDANNKKYVVVCLNAVDRFNSYIYNYNYTGIPNYQNATVFTAKETATYNGDAILAVSNQNPAVYNCRAIRYMINSEYQYGQLPTLMELVHIFEYREIINTNDPTATQYSSMIVPTSTVCLSSTQYSSNYMWVINGGYTTTDYKQNGSRMIIPVLEICLN